MRRTSAYSASGVKPPPRATVTRCCTSTSTGCTGEERDSTWAARTAARAAAASTISRLCVGTSVMREGRPGEWPERPARCSRRATPLAEPICSTRCTGAKSTPRSRLEVATTARRLPSLRPASTHSRTARSSEPWWMAICPAQSGRASSSAWYHCSACERTLTKTSVVLLAASSATTAGSMRRPRWPAQEKRSGASGSSVSTTSVLSTRPCTSTPPCAGASGASSVSMASGRLPSVADMPQAMSCGFHVASRASASCNCTPRLVPSSSCHSSATTRRTRDSCSCASARASSSDRLSGVVTSTVGRRRAWALRSPLAVSPVRAASVQRASGGCSRASSPSGSARAFSVSAARARMGVIHSTVSGSAVGCFASFSIAAGACPVGAAGLFGLYWAASA